jgi:hypothetical protein
MNIITSYVFHTGDVEKYKIRYVYGMKNILVRNRGIYIAVNQLHCF